MWFQFLSYAKCWGYKGNAYQLLYSGKLRYFKVGHVYRIPKLCVIDFLEKETKAEK